MGTVGKKLLLYLVYVKLALVDGQRRKKKSEGNLAACPAKQRKRKIDSKALKQYVAQNPDASQAEIAEHFHCSQQAICKVLKRNAITRKKRQSVIKNKIVKE